MTSRSDFALGPGGDGPTVLLIGCVPHLAAFGLRPLLARLLGRPTTPASGAALDFVAIVFPACAACLCEPRRERIAALSAALAALVPAEAILRRTLGPTASPSAHEAETPPLDSRGRHRALAHLRTATLLGMAFSFVASLAPPDSLPGMNAWPEANRDSSFCRSADTSAWFHFSLSSVVASEFICASCLCSRNALACARRVDRRP